MKTENYSNPLIGAAEHTSLAETVEKWAKICKNCNPLTSITCVTSCKIWRQKNEFRRLYEKMKNPSYLTKLLNTLKNKRRLQILNIASEGRYSLAKLQQELEKLGYQHSQKTIADEYLTPLVEIELLEENQENQYHATLFGYRLNELTRFSYDVADILPPHSECYEENALNMLLYEPKTFEDFKRIIPTKSIARVLDRLQKAELVKTTTENDYVFFFRTKRNPNNAQFSSTEKRVYENITAEGISARKLAEKTGISLRRTYRYLRKLKGKKLVFSRKRPKSYSLTAKGHRVAEFLSGVRNLTAEIYSTALHTLKDENHESLVPALTEQKREENPHPNTTTLSSKVKN
jgi:predicted transcriptional regulator/DNA-binding HxlR family transcriptional regulator